MIKAVATKSNGRRLLILGLSDINLEKLQEGKPIHFELDPLLGLEAEVMIVHGKTEAAIAETLGIPVEEPEPEIRH